MNWYDMAVWGAILSWGPSEGNWTGTFPRHTRLTIHKEIYGTYEINFYYNWERGRQAQVGTLVCWVYIIPWISILSLFLLPLLITNGFSIKRYWGNFCTNTILLRREVCFFCLGSDLRKCSIIIIDHKADNFCRMSCHCSVFSVSTSGKMQEIESLQNKNQEIGIQFFVAEAINR